MKYFFLLIMSVFLVQKSEAQFNKYFDDKSLRLDYYHCGNAETEKYFFDELIQEPYWAGSETNMIDNKEYGNHFVEVRTVDTNELVYSRGYCTLFDEWQTTPEAKTTDCCYPESVIVPFPREKVVVSILSRNKKGENSKRSLNIR